MASLEDVRALAAVTKNQSRKVERETHQLRRLSAQLCDAVDEFLSDTQEDTDGKETAPAPAYA